MNVVLWREDLTSDRAKRLCSVIEANASANRGKIAVLCLIETGGRPPEDAARREFARLGRLPGAELKCLAYVIPEGGFRAAVVRSVGLAVARLVSRGYKQGFFSDVDSAVTWMGQFVTLRSTEQVIVMVERIRRLLDGRGAF